MKSCSNLVFGEIYKLHLRFKLNLHIYGG